MAGEDAGGGDPVFMDRLNVNCGTGKILSQFKYERDGDSKQRYSVKCVEPSARPFLVCHTLQCGHDVAAHHVK